MLFRCAVFSCPDSDATNSRQTQSQTQPCAAVIAAQPHAAAAGLSCASGGPAHHPRPLEGVFQLTAHLNQPAFHKRFPSLRATVGKRPTGPMHA